MPNHIFKELQKFKTASAVDVPVTLSGSDQKIIMKMDEYTAGMGDIVELYVRHVNKPWWKRDMHHDHLSDYLKRWLNKLDLKTYW
jgi:adenosylcobinamide amidohydrolase